MDAEFRLEFSDRLKELTQDLRFYHKPTDGEIAPQIIETMFPDKGSDYKEGQHYPCVRWAIHSGAFVARMPQPFSIVIYGGVQTKDDIADGTRDILDLTMALGEIVNGKRKFGKYLLKNSIPFVIGDPARGREGLQPHPYYWVTLNLEFTVL